MKKLFSRDGFTLVEGLTVVMIVSFLSRIALPQVTDVRTQARAAAVQSDFRIVQLAAENYYADNNAWPADEAAGVTPAALQGDLPDGFSFDRGEYRLDWEHWTVPNGLPNAPAVRTVIGVSITTEDAALGAAVYEMIAETARFRLGDTYTFVFEAQ